MVRLNKTLLDSVYGEALFMELSSASDRNAKNNSKDAIIFQSAASHDPVPLLLSDKNPNNDDKIIAFHTDKTYIDDVVTIYKVKENQKTILTQF